MDRFQLTLALVVAAFAVAITYVKANTMPLDADMLRADIFTCQQSAQQSAPAAHASAHIVAMRPDATRSPTCLPVTN
ncbi:hypothetical protein [Hoeflea olei]|uniref:Uncharacterized protein n=1 Tax=Hoeflea olei TaxID=1480615 RepID=A0A1C1Z0C6_9HYPH|nr:hypothetical protein [Hoeflea olei]OCW59172.1 hypothetical protein AWJ14_08895 [Hoeflea olei]